MLYPEVEGDDGSCSSAFFVCVCVYSSSGIMVFNASAVFLVLFLVVWSIFSSSSSSSWLVFFFVFLGSSFGRFFGRFFGPPLRRIFSPPPPSHQQSLPKKVLVFVVR